MEIIVSASTILWLIGFVSTGYAALIAVIWKMQGNRITELKDETDTRITELKKETKVLIERLFNKIDELEKVISGLSILLAEKSK